MADVLVEQCTTEPSLSNDSTGCEDYTTVTAGRHGGLSIALRLQDPVYQLQGVLDNPAYCRADHCSIYLVWLDRDFGEHVLASQELTFIGSPATITVWPNSKLFARQWVHVSGTAFGAQGRVVNVVEQACYQLANERGCFGALPPRWAKVRADGTYSVDYLARRFLADGTDCAAIDEYAACEMNVIVLDAQGQPDDSFGVSGRGEPASILTFRTPRH